MLAYVYRLVSAFELEHGIHPNLLYLNKVYSEHLKTAFSGEYLLAYIMQLLNIGYGERE